MDEWIKELSNKLIDFKYTFVEANNNLLAKFEALNSKNSSTPDLLRPCVSNAVREVLNDKIIDMQKTTVNIIGSTFQTFCSNIKFQNANKNGIYNRRFEKDVIQTLEDSYRKNPYPSEQEKMRIKRQHDITIRQISNWFTNKRNRAKISSFRSSNSEDYYGVPDQFKN